MFATYHWNIRHSDLFFEALMLTKLLLDLEPGEPVATSGGGSAPVPAPDSTAGLSREVLDSRPSPTDLGLGDTTDAGGAELAPADPNLAAAVPATQSASQTATTIREAAKYYGLDLSQYHDDAQAFAYLAQAAHASRQNDYYTQLGRQIAPHYQDVQQYLATQQQAKPATQARKPWEAPEFDDRWLNLVERDANTGQYVAKQGVNPDFATKVQAYADHLDNWTTQLARNPMEALSGLIKHVADELYQGKFAQQTAVQEAQQIVQTNESWLYQTDANGRKLVGNDGKYVPSPMGARYYTHLQTLKASGVSDSRTLDALAKQLLQGDIYAGQFGQTATTPTPQSRAAASRPNVNPGGMVEPARRQSVPGAVEPSTEGLSLQEILRSQFAEGGVTDADFREPFAHS